MSEYEHVRGGRLVLKGEKNKSKKRKHKSKRVNAAPKVDADSSAHGNWWRTTKIEEITGPVAIEFGKHMYVTALDNGLFTLGAPHDEGDGPSPEEILTAVLIDEKKVAFKSGYGKYLRVEKNGVVTGRSDAIGVMEQWEPVFQEGKMALQSYTECFMAINDEDDAVVATDKKAGSGHVLQVRSQTVKDVNPMKDVPVEEQGDLEQVEVNYVWKRTKDNRKILMEKHDIRLKRIQYLKQLMQYRQEGRNIVYTDETYIHSSHTTGYEWTDGSSKELHKPVAKGKRLIIVHAGNELGFVENGLLIFSSGKKSGDYHDEMNWENFQKWLKSQLIPNLPPHSVLVVDNASYHNIRDIKEPTSATRKGDMLLWLEEKQIEATPSLTKPELYGIIKEHKSKHRVYKLDVLMASYGHKVLRLPPYHPELNPIEKIWASVKNWVAMHNTTFRLKDVEQLVRKRFAEMTAENWAAICRHVTKVEDDYILREEMLDEASEQIEFVVNTGSSDESFDESSEDENYDVSFPKPSTSQDDLGVAPLT